MGFTLKGRRILDAPPAARLIISMAFGFTCGMAAMCALGMSAAATPNKVAQEFRLEGVVLDQSGAPVADAQVSLNVAWATIGQARTGDDGEFVLNPGTATAGGLVVRARGFATAMQNWSARERAVAQLKIVLLPASISEQVTITATRTETRLGDTPSSVVILSPA